ncbi:MAG: hydroxypyruvate isomerase [Halomonadaceae bacterium]|nr:MAG: hydroxypyruvate isomerase [Halomonadaceae bacterium]
MPALAANLTLLFNEQPFLERFGAAASAGFTGVECLFPYQWPAAELAARLQDNGLQQVLFNAPPGDWDAGERGLACHPGRESEFRRGLEQAMVYADALNCPRIHCLSGLRPPGVSESQAWETLCNNLAWGADQLAGAGRSLMVEPINSRLDMPGYLMDRASLARTLIEQLGRKNVWLQFDLYHGAVMEDDLWGALKACLPVTGHIQFADYPGRHEPGSGGLPLAAIFHWLDHMGYPGWVAAEYHPQHNSEASLAALAPWLNRGSMASASVVSGHP